MSANVDYRAALAAPCPNRRLAHTVALFDDQVRAVMRLTLEPAENQRVTVSFHGQVSRGVRDHDPERAASAGRELLYRAEDDYLRRLGA